MLKRKQGAVCSFPTPLSCLGKKTLDIFDYRTGQWSASVVIIVENVTTLSLLECTLSTCCVMVSDVVHRPPLLVTPPVLTLTVTF